MIDARITAITPSFDARWRLWVGIWFSLAAMASAACLVDDAEYTPADEAACRDDDSCDCRRDADCPAGNCRDGVCSTDVCPAGFVDFNDDANSDFDDGCECAIDEISNFVQYADRDSDGSVIVSAEQPSCDGPPNGFEAPRENPSLDCDDEEPTVYPEHGGPKRDDAWLCDGLDNDCDGDIDESCCEPGAYDVVNIAPTSITNWAPEDFALVEASPDSPPSAAYLAIWKHTATLYAIHLDRTGNVVGELTHHDYGVNPPETESYPQRVIDHIEVFPAESTYDIYWLETYTYDDIFDGMTTNTHIRGVQLSSALEFPDTPENFISAGPHYPHDGMESTAVGDSRSIAYRAYYEAGPTLQMHKGNGFSSFSGEAHGLRDLPLDTFYDRDPQRRALSVESPFALAAEGEFVAVVWLYANELDQASSAEGALEIRIGRHHSEAAGTASEPFELTRKQGEYARPDVRFTSRSDGAPTLLITASLPTNASATGTDIHLWRYSIDTTDGIETTLNEHTVLTPPSIADVDDPLYERPMLQPSPDPDVRWQLGWFEFVPENSEWLVRTAPLTGDLELSRQPDTLWDTPGAQHLDMVIGDTGGLAYRHNLGSKYTLSIMPISADLHAICE